MEDTATSIGDREGCGTTVCDPGDRCTDPVAVTACNSGATWNALSIVRRKPYSS